MSIKTPSTAHIADTGVGTFQELELYSVRPTLGAAAAGRALEAQLYQTPAIEPITYATVAMVLVAVTAIACVVPTRRAVRVDPQSALRAE